MIDLGTHETTGQFGTKRQRKLRLSFELPEELHVFNEEKGERPYVVSQDFTFSMHEKGKLRPFLETWRGQKFTDEEARNFDISKLLGQPCMLNVMHNVAKNGNTYANIGSAARLPKGVIAPPQITPSTEISLITFDEDAFHGLPDWLRKKIAESDEYKALMKASEAASTTKDEDDDIPF